MAHGLAVQQDWEAASLRRCDTNLFLGNDTGEFRKVIVGCLDGSSPGFLGENEKGRLLSDLVSVSKSAPFLLIIFLWLLLKNQRPF